MSNLEPLMSSERMTWNTPLPVLERVRLVAPIGLDPCGNADSIVGADREYRLDRGEDGLALPWNPPSGCVYVNSEYGRNIGPWQERCVSQSVEHGVEIMTLVPARTDARWFDSIWCAAAICFWRGRLRFLGAPSSAPFPSVVAYFGSRPIDFIEAFRPVGRCVVPE